MNSQYSPAPSKNVTLVLGAQRTNSLGVAGVIVSCVGLLTLGLLSPVGLLLSLLGLFRAPRGAALAGVIIGLFGSLVLLAIVGFFFTVFGIMGGSLGHLRQMLAHLGSAAAVTRYYSEHERLPDDDAGKGLIERFTSLGAHPLRYARIDDQHFEIRSPGPDQQWQTADDLVSGFDINDLRQRMPEMEGLLPAGAPAAQTADEHTSTDEHSTGNGADNTPDPQERIEPTGEVPAAEPNLTTPPAAGP